MHACAAYYWRSSAPISNFSLKNVTENCRGSAATLCNADILWSSQQQQGSKPFHTIFKLFTVMTISYIKSAKPDYNIPTCTIRAASNAECTFRNCMTRFMRLLAAEPALSVPVVDDCNKSSIEILFLIAWYSSFWRVVSGQ